MEQYIIEDQVTFYPAGQQLTHIATEEGVALSVITTQILSLLIEQRGHVVERQTIFEEIFDRYGAASTNNNLNQYILNLRKQLQHFGILTEVIQTIPRIGFMIPAGVEIERTETPNAPVTKCSYPDNGESSVRLLTPLFTKIWIIAMLVVIAIAAYRFWHDDATYVTWSDYPLVKAIPLNDDKACQIFLIPSGLGYNPDHDGDYSSIINRFTGIDCNNQITTRYYLFQSAIRHEKYRSFVLKCTGNAIARPACFSRYVSVEQ